MVTSLFRVESGLVMTSLVLDLCNVGWSIFVKCVIDWGGCISSIEDDIIQLDEMSGWSDRVTERKEAPC